jgi:type VI protein secretion system component VasA
MNNMKKCSGCKEEKSLDTFYKNKRTNDGHSIYCVSCTKENSRKYHQRKKNKLQKVHSDEVVKNMVINNLISENNNPNAEVLMKLIMTERLLENALTELRSLKLSVSSNQMVSNIN